MTRPTKRDRHASSTGVPDSIPPAGKRIRHNTHAEFSPIKVASVEAAAAVDANPPFYELCRAVSDGVGSPSLGDAVLYWMRFSDLRTLDNKALSLASEEARKTRVPLLALFVISPQDYLAHDRGARRIDFVLRNASKVQESLHQLHIPMHVISHTPRTSIPSRIVSFLESLNITHLYANIEHEVDELRRDIKICGLANAKGIKTSFVHDKCVIEPGRIVSKKKTPFSVYSPYQRRWLEILNAQTGNLIKEWPTPTPNSESIRQSSKFSYLFKTPIPFSISGFELDEEDRVKMQIIWPEGEESANQILQLFLHTKARSSQMGSVDPFTTGAIRCKIKNRIMQYGKDRDRADGDTTSRLSPYLASGVISSRACLRGTMELLNVDKIEGNRSSGVGRWIQEIVWRDFYTNILASFPRVSMGRPFLERYSEIVWENHQRSKDSGSETEDNDDPDSEALKRWKAGQTGVPVVDAAMRCVKEMGWMHNRARMICAMYLVKNLMIDWRVGEKYFMEMLIDGDLSSNNGGWQWCASTGADACPYFRIFNPYTQSLKMDPTGDFIKLYVPELESLGKSDIHKPLASTAERLGYPAVIIPHDQARVRALRRFKNPGQQ